MSDALFEQLAADTYLPGPFARGPWSPQALHGGPVAALLARAVEPLLGDLQPMRVTVELLRPVPLSPLRATATLLRPGKKVRLAAAQLATEDGTVVASATALGIRRAEVPVPAAAEGTAPPAPATVEASPRTVLSPGPDYDGFHNAGVEHRFVAGSFEAVGPASDWIRLAVPVLAGEAPSPLQRVMGAADFGNGISRVVEFTEAVFINPDLTVHLHRLPVGEWVCLQAASHLEGAGVGLAQSALWDEQGPLGRALQSLLVERR
jgi:hypothetical protein